MVEPGMILELYRLSDKCKEGGLGQEPEYYTDVDRCVDDIIRRVGTTIVMAAPLALAKPAQLINAMYRRAKRDPDLHFTLITAVSLEKPTWSSELEKRFLQPLVERIWGDFPDFDYVLDMRKGLEPSNFELVEFFNKAGGWLTNTHASRNYLGSNYTHAVRDAMLNGCNVLTQLVAKKKVNGQTMLSMSSNPDTHLEGLEAFRQAKSSGKRVAVVAQVNSNLPFMYGKAVVSPDCYDMIIDTREYDFTLFGAPKESVSTADWMIGLHASTLVRDGGTLQVGIGSLGDAIVAGLGMRHADNDAYRRCLDAAGIYVQYRDLIDSTGGITPFETGLLGSSEMLVDSLLELFKNGIIKRRVYDDVRLQRVMDANEFEEHQVPLVFRALIDARQIHRKIKPAEFAFLQQFGIFKDSLIYDNGDAVDGNIRYPLDLSRPDTLKAIEDSCLSSCLKNGIQLYASFFIGPQAFYRDLREMDEPLLRRIDMRGVDYVNQLYGDEELKRLQRRHGRFINAGLMATLTGAVVADGLEDNRIISGPGGQYNFVSMAHALDDARAVTMIRSTRGTGKNTVSNIVWQYGHTTIPRHLRDIIVTEYGIADLRGQKDWVAMTRMICIADSRFQQGLLDRARQAGKIPLDWQIPERFRNNYPEMLETVLRPFRAQGLFRPFPFGTDLTDEEVALGRALKSLKDKTQENRFAVMQGLMVKSLAAVPDKARPLLSRMGLSSPSTIQERLMQKLVLLALGSLEDDA